jgi:dCMP deaminase
MIGATLYLAGREAKSGEYVANPAPCSMCKRLIINAGISKVIARTGKTEYTVTDVSEWVENDESLAGKFGY